MVVGGKPWPTILPSRQRAVLSHARRRTVAVDLTTLALGATLLAWPSFGWPLTSLDESVLLVYAEQVRAGLVPHRDFFTVYGPAPFYLLATLFAGFGSSLGVERALGLALHLAIALGCYGVGRSRDRTTALLAGAASLVLLAPLGTVPYAWLGAMACLALALAMVGKHTRHAGLAAGVLAGLGPAFRPELLVVVVPVLLPYLWRCSRWRWIASGLALGLAPLGGFSLAAGTRMWWNIGPGRAGVNGAMSLLDDPVRSVAILASVLGVTSTLVWLAWKRRSRASMSHALLALGILPQTLQRVDPDHALYTLCVTVPLVIVVGATADRSADALRRRKMLAAAMAVAFVGGLAAMVLRPSPATVTVRFQDRSAIVAASELPDLTATRTELLRHAPPGGSLFVGSSDMSTVSLSRIIVYYLLPELRPRAYFLELAVGVSERAGSGLVNDVRNADVLLLTRMPDGLMRQLYPYLPPGSDEANEVVRREFCPVSETGWGMLYQHRPCTN
ncbi:hypothetical protein GCM10009740_03270 [Terrabacter terrae]|uniref:Glycosyltransferase RgtA/B/C/D-like domain-containing protein n=1 Tax=Terrabacter terrae TaxID=318434 RepID=A0ABP5F6M9_9MICO